MRTQAILIFSLLFNILVAASQNPPQDTIPNTPKLNITAPPVPEQEPQHHTPSKPQPLLSGINKVTKQQQYPQNKPQFPQSNYVQPLKSKQSRQKPLPTTERVLTQTQPSLVMEGTIEGQEVHYKKTQTQQGIELEVYKVRQTDLNYQHIKTYAFQLQDRIEFHLKVQHDIQIKGTFMIYWEIDRSFIESQYQSGQEVEFSVFLNRQSLLVHQTCYRTNGFKFYATKGNTYSLFFKSQGHRKMLSMVMQNYMSEKSGVEKFSTQHADQHQMITEKVKNTLRTFYNVVQKNFMINQQIAYNVTVSSKRYMSYQIVEMLMVILGACVQIYLIRKLLNPQSVV